MASRVLNTFADEVAALAFPPAPGGAPPRIGAEVEFLALERTTGRVASIETADEPATLPVLRALAREAGWVERRSQKAGVPEFITRSGGRVTFEPGGQIEYASPPADSLRRLVADLRGVTEAITARMDAHGIALVATGIDPLNAIEDVPLQLDGERYRRMDAHFASIGPHGARMMRQTASIQISLDAGERPFERWTLLNALAPWLVAIFANSPRYAGVESGHQSLRRHVWGELDPSRTGLAWDRDEPVEAYAQFALDAVDILHGGKVPPFDRFGTVIADGRLPPDGLAGHLSTLFPEVRPRGWFEVRSTDALAPCWYAAPLVFLAGLAYTTEGAARALEVTGSPDAALLERAGICGLVDPALARSAIELFRLALRGCESLGRTFVGEAELSAAWEFFERYTRRGRSPAADAPITLPG